MAFFWPATVQPNVDDPHVGHSRLGKPHTTKGPAASWMAGVLSNQKLAEPQQPSPR